MRTPIDVFLPSFAKNGKAELAEVIKRVRGIHHEKRLVLSLSLGQFWSDLAENFTESLFPHSPSRPKFCPNPFNFRGDISENVFQTYYNQSNQSLLYVKQDSSGIKNKMQ